MNRIKHQKLRQKNNPDHPVNLVLKTKTLVYVLLDWFAANARDLPWRRTRDPYAIWVSEIMLQQTQVKTVIPYWERWMRELPTIESLAAASTAKIHKLWEGLGYYTRVRNMQKAAQQILAEHGGKFPQTFDAVLALPGIGRYTAGAICSIAFNQPTPILDGNVIRVLTRIHGIKTDPREKNTNARLWTLAEELVTHAKAASVNTGRPLPVNHSDNSCSHLNQSLMELGALICTPRAPQCLACPVRASCFAFRNNLQETLPNVPKRAAATERKFVALVIESHGKFLIRQRPAGVVNAHLWEFPNFEIGAPNLTSAHEIAKNIGVRLSDERPFRVIKHAITRYRITLTAWRAVVVKNSSALAQSLKSEWHGNDSFTQLAFSSAHQKLVQAIMPR